MNNKNEKLQGLKDTPAAEVAKEQRTENELREKEERIGLLALASNDDGGQAKRVASGLPDMTDWRPAEEAWRAVSRRLLNLQEEERRRIAHELHDSTAQKMTSILLNLRLLQEAENPEQAKRLTATCVSAAEDCIQEIRTLSYVLHPPLLDELGLAAALDSYVTGFSRRSGIRVNLDVDRGVGELSQDVALALFRMVQESLANVHRHSGSAVASVQLMQTRNRVILEVGDQGRGIAPETLEQLKAWRYDRGVGIMGMRERLEQLGGTLEIESSSGGTLVRAIVAVGQK